MRELTKIRLREIADAVRQENIGIAFRMSTYVSDEYDGCGTAACVAGTAVYLYDRAAFNIGLQWSRYWGSDDARPREEEPNLFQLGAEVLGIDGGGPNEPEYVQAMELFHAISLSAVSGMQGTDLIDAAFTEHVPAALRWMADTGTINWLQALEAVGADPFNVQPTYEQEDERELETEDMA